MTQPPIPLTSIVFEVIGLADAYAAAGDTQRPPEHRVYGIEDFDLLRRPIPEREALLDYLQRLPDETVAGLYALLRLYDLPSVTTAEAEERYRVSFDLAMAPMACRHGAADLVAKGHLADGLRRGLEQLGLGTDPDAAGSTVGNMLDNTRRTMQ